MRRSPRRIWSASFAIALAAGTVTVPTAFAATDNSNVVINEVYGGGGNKGATLTHDFVELYNPTDAPIDLTGWTVTQRSSTDSGNGTATLSGTIPAKGYYLVQGAQGNGGTDPLPTPDATGKGLTFGGSEAIARLIDANGNVVDLVGWGAATVSEGTPAGKTKNTESVQRKQVGVDTDNNADDFIVAAPTPQNSGQDSSGEPNPQPNPDPDPADPNQPEPPAPQPPAGALTIAEIQGSGDKSPYDGRTVTTAGVVTAVYEEGGKAGFYMQTAGTGSEKNSGEASDGIFVSIRGKKYPQIGDSVTVTGQVQEYYTRTQINLGSITNNGPATDAERPKAVQLEKLPDGDEARERYEGMLVRLTGPYTVTNNYTLNSYGEIGLAPGTEPHRNPTDFQAPGEEATAEENARQKAELVSLDDGRTRNYLSSDKTTPLPYVVTGDQGLKSIRTGDQVKFETDTIVEYQNKAWKLQPLEPITGKSEAGDLPISWEDSRASSYDVPDTVKGDLSIGFFNVLNYFTSLGKDEAGCNGYTDKDGVEVAANNCKVRGAYTQQAFQDQQAKIVSAINKLDTDVLGLSEIENTYKVTGDIAQRDYALNDLVGALNKADSTKNWKAVTSPTEVGASEDVIRVAFIYNAAKVEPVGESRIFNDNAFTGIARQPLAQEFNTLTRDDDDNFVAVVNHYKSKGSVARGDADDGDGQGNNARLRAAMSQALVDALNKQDDWQNKPTFLLGDFNAYTKEDAITVLEQNGYELVHHDKDFDQASYQFGGQLGTLDHVLANEAARAWVTDSAVWNINGDESVAWEYSRRNYNAQDFINPSVSAEDDKLYGYGNPFRSSDHDPVKVGFTSIPKQERPDDPKPEDPKDPSAEPKQHIVKAEVNADGDLIVTYDNGETENLGNVKGPKGDTGATGAQGETGPAGKDGRSVAGQDGQDGRDGNDGKPGQDGRGVSEAKINDKGELVLTYTDGTEKNLGRVTGAHGQDGKDGDAGQDGKDGADGQDGRGIASAAVNEAGELVLTYTDGTEKNLGRVTGAHGQDGKDGSVGQDGRGIVSAEVNKAGELLLTYSDGTTQNLGKVTGEPGATGARGEQGQPGQPGQNGKDGKDGADGRNGQAGKDGRGVKAFEINDEGNLIVTYSDGETADLGKVTGDAGTGEAGQDGQAGADGKDGKDGRGIANLEVNDEGELIATYTDGETQNLGRVAGADGAAGKDGKDGANAPAPAPANEGSSVSDRCLPALGIMTLPLLALVPLGLAATMDIPALAPVKEQLNNVGAQLPISPEMQMMAGGVAGTALAVAAIATLAIVCTTEGGSSE